jgi:hypothetical protein
MVSGMELRGRTLLTWKAIKPQTAFFTKPATFTLGARLVLESFVEQTVPLTHELADIESDGRLKLQDVLLGKDVRDYLALARMVSAVPRIE